MLVEHAKGLSVFSVNLDTFLTEPTRYTAYRCDSYENTYALSNLLWSKGDGKAQLFQAMGVMLLNTSDIEFFEVVSSQVSVRLLGTQDMVHHHQQAV